MPPPATLVAALGCLVVPGALLVGAAGARTGHRLRGGHAGRWISALAGLLLLVLVAGDLLPDALEESAELGSPFLLVTAPAALSLAAAGLVLWRPATAAGCCSRATGLLTAGALAGHGILEGFVVGVGVGVGLTTAVGVIALLAGHRLAEGFALGTALRSASRRTRGALLLLASVAPLVGGAAGETLDPGPVQSVVTTAVLAGLLAAAGLRLVAGLPTPPRVRIAPAAVRP